MNVRHIDPPQELEQLIINRIHSIQKRSAALRLVGTVTLALASLGLIIPSISYLVSALDSSGFYSYVSLVLSDSSALLSYWKEFSLSLAESLPYFALALSLGLIGLFIWSSYRATKNVQLLAIY